MSDEKRRRWWARRKRGVVKEIRREVTTLSVASDNKVYIHHTKDIR